MMSHPHAMNLSHLFASASPEVHASPHNSAPGGGQAASVTRATRLLGAYSASPKSFASPEPNRQVRHVYSLMVRSL